MLRIVLCVTAVLCFCALVFPLLETQVAKQQLANLGMNSKLAGLGAVGLAYWVSLRIIPAKRTR